MNTPEPSTFDIAIYEAISDALKLYLTACYIDFEWSEGAHMWYTTVTPQNTAAATMSFAFDGTDLISVTIGNAWFEMFPKDKSTLSHVAEIVTAVAAGNAFESGPRHHACVHIELPNDTLRGGPLRLPVPLWLRSRRNYQAYDEPLVS